MGFVFTTTQSLRPSCVFQSSELVSVDRSSLSYDMFYYRSAQCRSVKDIPDICLDIPDICLKHHKRCLWREKKSVMWRKFSI